MALELWTRVECLCGRAAAIPEGGWFPICGGCGRRMVVPSGVESARVSMVCEPMSTTEAVKRCDAFRPGGGAMSWRDIPGHARLYSDEDLRGVLERLEWPTEPCDFWPEKEMPDGAMTRVAPWEV